MRHLRRLLHCLAAGALAGAAICPLQLLLWPEMALSTGSLVLAAALWASWGAAWLGSVSFLVVEAIGVFSDYVAAAPGLSIGLWRWLFAVHSFLVAGVAFFNRERTRQLLVESHRDALSVAGGVAALVAIVVLVAALRRRRTSRPWWMAGAAGAVLVGGAWAGLAGVPRVELGPPPTPPPPYTTHRRLLFVSWEGADLPWLVPAVERGDMPFLRALRDGGAWGQVRTLTPYSRTAALTTLVTGCRPSVHGVIGRRGYRLPWLSPTVVSLLLEGPWPTPHQLPWRSWERAATPMPRRAPLWDILEQSGQSAGVAGWPGIVRASWQVLPPLAAESVPFSSLDEELRSALQPALTAHPGLAPATRVAFSVAVQLAASATLEQAARPVEALFLDVDLPARLRPLWTFEAAEPTHGEVLGQAARLLDDQLSELWSAVGGGDALLVLVSPYGMAPPSPWRRLEHLFGGGEKWRVSPKDSPDGFVLFSGPGVEPGARLSGCKLADVTATTLYLLGLPVARDMSGKVLLDAVSDERASPAPLRLVPSYPPGPHRGATPRRTVPASPPAGPGPL